MAIKIEVIDKDLQATLKAAREQISDFTIPFKLIGQQWFKSNRAIADLKSPGKYQDLSPAYKKAKQRSWGFIYPILKASGRLLSSITSPGSESINLIINKQTLLLGSTVPYGIYHQLGTAKMPARPWILIGAEQTAPPELNNRKDAWLAIINKYVSDIITKNGGR